MSLGFGKRLKFDLNSANEVTGAPGTWVQDDFTISIERGVWTGARFESLEGDWQSRHPAAPRHFIFNAVRIYMHWESSAVGSFLGRALGGIGVREVEYIVKAGELQANAEIAPFALLQPHEHNH